MSTCCLQPEDLLFCFRTPYHACVTCYKHKRLMAKGQPISVGLGTHSCAPQHSAQRDTPEWLNLSGLLLKDHTATRDPVPEHSLAAQTTPASFGSWPLGSPPWDTFPHQLGLPSWYLLLPPSMCSQAELRQCRQGTVPWRTQLYWKQQEPNYLAS